MLFFFVNDAPKLPGCIWLRSVSASSTDSSPESSSESEPQSEVASGEFQAWLRCLNEFSGKNNHKLHLSAVGRKLRMHQLARDLPTRMLLEDATGYLIYNICSRLYRPMNTTNTSVDRPSPVPLAFKVYKLTTSLKQNFWDPIFIQRRNIEKQISKISYLFFSLYN